MGLLGVQAFRTDRCLAVQDGVELFVSKSMDRFWKSLGDFSVEATYPVGKKEKSTDGADGNTRTRSQNLGKPYKQIVSGMRLALGLTDATTSDHLDSLSKVSRGHLLRSSLLLGKFSGAKFASRLKAELKETDPTSLNYEQFWEKLQELCDECSSGAYFFESVRSANTLCQAKHLPFPPHLLCKTRRGMLQKSSRTPWYFRS